MTSRSDDNTSREAQIRILLDVAMRLERGDPPLPLDVMAPLVEEIESRVATETITAAWAEEGRSGPPSIVWRSERPANTRRAVLLLRRAERDLAALSPADKVSMTAIIEGLTHDPLPRGAHALHGRAENHILFPVGGLRLYYSIREDALLIVAVAAGTA